MQGEGSLSKEDIDALLMGSEDADVATEAEEKPQSDDNLTKDLGDMTDFSSSASDAEEEPVTVKKEKTIKKHSKAKNIEFEDSENMELLLDVKMNLSVELGRAKMQIEKVLDLGPGAVVELDKLNGEYVDIMVNNRLVARGEVVAVDETFGVRIVEIIDPSERFKIEL